MFGSSLAVPLHFTVEFVGFLVLAGGAFLIASRPALVPGDPGRRRLVTFGFTVLAFTHVAHGGSFIPADGDEVLALVRAMGFALMLVGLAGKAEAPASAAATLSISDPIPLIPGALAGLSAIAALTGSFRGGPKTHRRLALGLVFMAASELLTASAPDYEFGIGEGDSYAYVAHGLKFIAFAAIGSWLWTGVRSSIRTRFVASFVALLVVVVLALATTLTAVISNQVEDEELRRVDIQLGAALENVKDDQAQLLQEAKQAARFGEVTGRMRDNTLSGYGPSLAQGISQFSEADFVILDPAAAGGIEYARITTATPKDVPPLNTKFALSVLGSDVVRDLSDKIGDSALDIQEVDNTLLLIAAVDVPLTDQDGDPLPGRPDVGAVVFGRYFDQFQIGKISNSFDPAKASLIVRGKTVASELPREPRRRLLPPDVRARVEAGQEVQVQQAFGRRSYFTAFMPIRSAREEVVGVLALSSPASIVAETRKDVTTALFLVAMAAAAVALALAWYSGRRITRPIQMLTSTAREVRQGNLEAQAPVSGADEVGQLGETFNEMTLSLLRLTEDLRLSAREEQQLRTRIETIIESMADGLVAVDSNRNVLAFNLEAQHLTGRSLDEALGHPLEEVVSVRSGKGDQLRLPVYDLGAGSTTGVFIQRTGGMDPIPVSVTSAVLHDEYGEVAGAVAVIRDMTREREIERMKSEFLSNISHELRTPLTPIKGYAEILTRKEVPPDKIKRFTQGILDSTSRLERIVELLVDFSAMEAGRLAPKSTPVDLAEIVRQLGEKLEERSTRHEVVVDIKSRVPKVVGDERLLKRSLEEVLDNAVKFSPHGGTITLEVRGVTSDNGQGKRKSVAVTVADEGIGIEPENLERIFSDFQQLDGSETRAYGGLGLGLAFVQRIVEAHEGQVDVDSKPDEGTRFTITLPGESKSSRTFPGESKPSGAHPEGADPGSQPGASAGSRS